MFSSIETAAILRLTKGARISCTYWNQTSLQKWVDYGIAEWRASSSFPRAYVVAS